MKWGSFPELPIQQRIYARAYWRFLLGWELPPSRQGLPPDIARKVRQLAREEVSDYQQYVLAHGGPTLYAYQEKARRPP